VVSRDPEDRIRLAVVTSGQTTPTETFILAHLQRLPFEITHLYGYHDQYLHQNQSVRSILGADLPSLTSRLSNLLPQYLAIRVRHRFEKPLCDRKLLGRFLVERKIDAVLAEYGMIGAFLAPVCEDSGIPLVVHFHGADATKREYVVGFSESYKTMFAYVSACIAVSKKMCEDLMKLGCAAEKIRLCPYGPDDRFFACHPNYHSDQMIAIGRLTEKKAPHLTILAFAEVLKSNPNLRLVMIGDGELRGVCEDLVKSLYLEGKVFLRGAQTPEQIRCEIDRSFLFVQHSVQAWDGDCEGTPVSVLEAGAAGLPVVATRHAGISDVVIHEKTGMLCEERDIKTMANYLRLLANDREKTRAFGAAAQNHIRNNFSMDTHLTSLSSVISNCVLKV